MIYPNENKFPPIFTEKPVYKLWMGNQIYKWENISENIFGGLCIWVDIAQGLMNG